VDDPTTLAAEGRLHFGRHQPKTSIMPGKQAQTSTMGDHYRLNHHFLNDQIFHQLRASPPATRCAHPKFWIFRDFVTQRSRGG